MHSSLSSSLPCALGCKGGERALLRATRRPSSRLVIWGMFLRSVAGMRAAPMIPTVEMAQELIEYVVYMAVGFDQGVDVSLEGGVGCDGP